MEILDLSTYLRYSKYISNERNDNTFDKRICKVAGYLRNESLFKCRDEEETYKTSINPNNEEISLALKDGLIYLRFR